MHGTHYQHIVALVLAPLLLSFIAAYLPHIALPYPTPANKSCRTPSNESASSLDDPSARAGSYVNGILVILALAGCTDKRGTHREPLRARFGGAVAERMEALARLLHEGVSSAWFEIAVKNPSVTPVTRSWVAPGKSGPAVERSIPCRPSVFASCSQIPLTQTAPSNSRSANLEFSMAPTTDLTRAPTSCLVVRLFRKANRLPSRVHTRHHPGSSYDLRFFVYFILLFILCLEPVRRTRCRTRHQPKK